MKPPRLLARTFDALRAAYGEPRWKRERSALDCLILTVLSQNTNDRNSFEGFRRLRARFRTWPAVENAPWEDVAAAIQVSGLHQVKAKRIQDILRRVRTERGRHSLEFLRAWDVKAAHDYLMAIPGVGRKTAACVLLFTFGMPVLPVDTHIHRVSRRLGLVDARATAEQAHDALQALTPDAWVYPLHLLLIQHGRTVCHARAPRCPACVLLSLCPFGKSAAVRPP